MILDEHREQILEVLGKSYSRKVRDELSLKGVLNRYGRPHSFNMIRQVMNGNTEHEQIETAIYDAVKRQHDAEVKKKKYREEILKKTKTGAATPA